MGLFHENADEVGLPWPGPPTVARRNVAVDGTRRVSALVWGSLPPEVVLLHGGAQNAHTWDTVALAFGRPLVAIDLPGHGHSDWRDDHGYWPAEHRRRRRRRHPRAGAGRRDASSACRSAGSPPGASPAQHPELVRRSGDRRRHAGHRRGEGRADPRVRLRPRALRELRRDPRAHRAVQPDALGVVVAPRHPAQRGRAAPTAVGRWRYDPMRNWSESKGMPAFSPRVVGGRRRSTCRCCCVRGGTSNVVGDEDVEELLRRRPEAHRRHRRRRGSLHPG